MERKATSIMKKPKRASTLAQAMAKQSQQVRSPKSMISATMPAQGDAKEMKRANTFHGGPTVKASPSPDVPQGSPAPGRKGYLKAMSVASPASPSKPTAQVPLSAATCPSKPISQANMRTATTATSARTAGAPRSQMAASFNRASDASSTAEFVRTASTAAVLQGQSPRLGARTSPSRGRPGGGAQRPGMKARTLPVDLPDPEAEQSPAPRKMAYRCRSNDMLATDSGTMGMQHTSTYGSQSPVQSINSRGFGSGSRMEPTKWKRWASMVDRQTLGAHYSYIVGDLSSAFSFEDIERAEHDERMASSLHRRHPDEAPHPREGEPLIPAAAAFPDRAGRLREGRGARRAMLIPEAPQTDWAVHGECTCAVCRPATQPVAGQPSHLVHYNRMTRCSKDHHPERLPWEADATSTLYSGSLSKSLPHLDGNPELPGNEEDSFKQCMGRKIKHPTPTSPGGGSTMLHRSFSVDCVCAAGGYNQALATDISEQRCHRRQAWQGSQGDAPVRTGVALAMSMREGDPPPPTKIAAVTKAPGLCRDTFTEESEKSTVYFNQETFRFANPANVRGRSQPPPALDRDFAGTPSGEWGSHIWRKGDPISMDGTSARSQALGSTSGRPAASFRTNPGNRSDLAASVLDHDRRNQLFAMHTDYRMKTEPHFAALCAMTQDTMVWGKTMSATIKSRNGHARSGSIKEQLQWIED